METFVQTFSELAAVAAGSLVAAAWEGLVLTAVVAVGLWALRGISAAARSVVWTVALIVVVSLPFLRFGEMAAGVGADSARWHVDARVSVALACVWVAISLFRAAQLVRSAVWLRGVARRAVPVEAAANVGHPRGALLCVSDEVDRPSVIGFLAPRILIPGSLLEKLTAGELEHIVLHETEHLRRGDDWTNLLQKLSLVVFPLNPALLWIERRLCLERELACDDHVLQATNARKAYAACLANLAEHSLVRRGVSLALGAWERRPELVRRVHRILFRTEREMGRRQAGLAVATMLLGLLGGADLLAHAPRMVSFGPGAGPVAQAVQTGYRVPGVRSENVVFHPGNLPLAPAQPVRVKAKRVHAEPKVVTADLSPEVVAPLPTDRLRGGRDEGLGGMVVLVTWRAVRTTVQDADGNTVPVTLQSPRFSYAAVPTRDGWLFVQL